jgi:hypothetical protein
MSEWCRMFFETYTKEKKMHKEFLARSKAVADAAEKATVAMRAAEDARRLFESDFGHAPTNKRAGSPPIASSSKKMKEEDDAKDERRLIRSIQKFVGADSGDAISKMTHKVFSHLNADSDVNAIPKERFHAKSPVTIKMLRDAKKERGEILAPKEWDHYKHKVMERCVSAGRIASFSNFFKVNRKYIAANHKEVNKSELWKQYNEAWDALCGTVLKRIPNPADAAQRKKKKNVVEVGDSLETVAADTTMMAEEADNNDAAPMDDDEDDGEAAADDGEAAADDDAAAVGNNNDEDDDDE